MPTRTPMPGDPGYGPIVRHGRNPLAVVLLLVLVFSAIVGLVSPAKASPTLTLVLGDAAWLWHVSLLIGTVTTLIGVLFLKPLNDVLVERIGSVWLASIFLVYGAVLAIMGGSLGATSAGISISLGCGFALRAWQITKDLQRLHRVLQALPGVEGPGK